MALPPEGVGFTDPLFKDFKGYLCDALFFFDKNLKNYMEIAMKKPRKHLFTKLLAIPSLFLVAGSGALLLDKGNPDPENAVFTGMGDAQTLARHFERWQASQQSKAPDQLTIALRAPHEEAQRLIRGQFRLNLKNGELTVTLTNAEKKTYSLWLVDKPDDGGGKQTRAIQVGNLAPGKDGRIAFNTRLSADLFPPGFHIDKVTITTDDRDPEARITLAGSPSLFQRLYHQRRPWQLARVGTTQTSSPARPALAFLLPKPAMADAAQDTNALLTDLIAEGRRIFHKETFDGNGRTCGTCHREDNNFTIDPNYIAKLPSDDPLFVHEHNPDLATLEHPVLLRQLALFQANVDGFDRPPVLRGVPHILSLITSSDVEDEDSDVIASSTGWSGDGAPGDGSLRMFAVGAIRQHMTRTLNREEGVDFRLPTEYELDALEAYMLSLGRQQDPDLETMVFNNPIVERGKLLFNTKKNPVDDEGNPVFGQSANCKGCHVNGGGHSSSTHANPIRDTGVENAPDTPAHLLDPAIAYDGGFGQEPRNCGPNLDQPCFGDGRFSTQTVIEAADTPPYFHNNSANTIEQVVAFYTGPAFNNSPGALTGSGSNRQIKLDASQMTAIALFLRAINAVENIDSANRLDQKAKALNRQDSRKEITLALAETEDALEVLQGGVLNVYPQAVIKLRRALRLEKIARRTVNQRWRNRMLDRAIRFKSQAKDLIVTDQE